MGADIVLKTIVFLDGKSTDYQDSYLSGLGTGMGIQARMFTQGSKYNHFNPGLIRVLKINQERGIEAVLRDLNSDWEHILEPGLFINWKAFHGEFADLYFTQMACGCMLVADWGNEIYRLSNLNYHEIGKIIEGVVERRIAELNKLF